MSSIPGLPLPEPLRRCPDCGEPLTLEMEVDEGQCANCMAEAAEASKPKIHPIFAGIFRTHGMIA